MRAGRGPAASRLWHGLLALLVAVTVAVQLDLVVRGEHVLTDPGGVLPGVGTRVVRFLSYFTVESNLLVMVSAALLAVDANRDGPVFRAVRLAALVGITVTGVVYVLVLRPLVDLSGTARLTDTSFHYVVPVAAVLGWLLFGPRPRVPEGTVGAMVVWPVLYVGWTLLHGAASGWWPYPFVDADRIGYGATVRNGVLVLALLLGVATAFRALDRGLAPTDRRW